MGKRGIWDHSWASSLGNGIRRFPFPQVRECKRVGVSGDKMMHFILDVSCRHTGNTCTNGMLSSWTPCDGFHTCSLPWAKYVKNKNQSFVGVYIVLLPLQKPCIKAHVSWLDCFVKRTYERTPRWSPPEPDYKRRATDWGAAKESLRTSFELVLPVLRKRSALTSHCHPSGGRADPLCQRSAQSLWVSLLIHQQHCSQDPGRLWSRSQGWM